jgi:hypothetical protein
LPADEITIVKERIKKKEKLLKEAEDKGDKKSIEKNAVELSLLLVREGFLEVGGPLLEAPDDLAQINFLLKKKKALLDELESNLSNFPKSNVEYPNYKEIERTLNAQCEYLRAKYTVISERRPLQELGRYMQLSEAEGVCLVASPLEHEAELKRFKPGKKEKRKKGLVLDFRKIALVLIVLSLLFSFYVGSSWRKTPYDREIIRSYVTARNHYLLANDYYVLGDYSNSIKEYATAAAFFNQAKIKGELAASSQSGKMKIYFDNKRKFFEGWEQISLKMIESSKAFQSDNFSQGKEYAGDAVRMADQAQSYNLIAEEAWRL